MFLRKLSSISLVAIVFCCNAPMAFPASGTDQSAPRNKENQKERKKDIGALEKAVEKALEKSAKSTPSTHKDALRVWKNFKQDSPRPNWTYRSWGHNLAELVRQEKVVLDSQAVVADMFGVLYEKGLISKHAVFVLATDVWSYLVYRYGIPEWDKPEHRMNQERPSKETPV